MSAAARIYDRLPTPLQHAATTAYGYGWRHRRRGGEFALRRAEFLARDRAGEAEWREVQAERLRAVLARAATAPFYRARWAALGRPSDLADVSLDELALLPTTSKEDVRRDPVAFCPGGAPPAGSLAWHTSGSTGTPLVTFHSAADLRRAFALRDARYRTFVGVDHSLPRATFSGRSVVRRSTAAGPFHRYNHAERQWYFSPYHLGPATVDRYARDLARSRSEWLTGYASTIGDLARLALERGLPLPRVRAAITIAEPLPAVARAAIAEAFGCRVAEEYGLAEESCFALECERGSLHVSPDAGVVEILDEEGVPCAPGEVGEIVATGFLREAQPLVRYRTGDLASWAAKPCACGRAMPVLATLEGRVGDALLTPDGRRITRLTAVARGLPGVVYMQFVQSRPDEVSVRVVSEGPLDRRLRAAIADRLRARVGDAMAITVERVDEPVRTARGKVRTVVGELAP